MDSINGLNHFSAYIVPQPKISSPQPDIAKANYAAGFADGFEHCAKSDAVMNQTDALKFLSSADRASKSQEITSVGEIKDNVSDIGFSLNGIGSSSFFYLEI